MTRYRKRPVEIDAMGPIHPSNIHRIAAWCNGERVIIIGDGALVVHTLEGTMTANWGDYVIKGVAGEFYPCKAHIFVETYERVDE